MRGTQAKAARGESAPLSVCANKRVYPKSQKVVDYRHERWFLGGFQLNSRPPHRPHNILCNFPTTHVEDTDDWLVHSQTDLPSTRATPVVCTCTSNCDVWVVCTFIYTTRHLSPSSLHAARTDDVPVPRTTFSCCWLRSHVRDFLLFLRPCWAFSASVSSSHSSRSIGDVL